MNYYRIVRIKNLKFSRYYFYLKTNTWRDFKYALVHPNKRNENHKNPKQKATKNAYKV